MNQSLRSRLTDPAYLGGMGLLLVNCILFYFGSMSDGMHDSTLSGFFFFHFASSALAFVGQFIVKSPFKRSIHTIVLLLLLISAYALNRHVPVFTTSATWLTIALIITGVSFLLFHFWDMLPGWSRCLLAFVMGVDCLVLLYLAIYLFPLYPLSLIVLVALGLSIHTFVPLMLLIQAFRTLKETAFKVRYGVIGYWTGFLAALIFAVTYCLLYNTEVRRLNHAYNRAIAEGSGHLPAWVEASALADGGMIEGQVLKTDLVYTQPKWEFIGFDDRLMRNFDERAEHDPLVVMAAAFSPTLEIPEDERIRILESMYDARHQAQERLWSGNDLYTAYVNSKVKIWPELHLAYTEKVISVTNSERYGFGGQEAIYTFHMPEGSVVTSLSLWVNGKEEKAFLTTKEKADTAYRTIVGVESRDPSLVRWQEGNTVAVRVFPVMPGESRKFRVGFTTPLTTDGKELRYDNIYFDGPSAINATEDASTEFVGKAVALEGFSGRRSGRYKPDWHVTMKDDGIEPGTFSFSGNAYTMQPYQLVREKVETRSVYLDVNAAWSSREFNDVLKLVAPRPAYVWLNDEMMQVGEDNRDECLKALQARRFSLFPLHRISSPVTSLLISKSTPVSPSLADLQSSEFRRDLSEYLSMPGQPKVRLLNIGEELSPYLRSLKEYRVFRYEKGGIFLLKVLLDGGAFAADIESPDTVVIDQANMAIVRQDRLSAGKANTAPDHLMRLFAYNHIMQQTGKGLMTGSAGQDTLVTVAQQAHVVSPLSSLIVLETQKDYDRFNIKDKGNSLKNASMKSTGAVPEPHEWALIILVLLTLVYIKFRPAWSKANV